VKSDLVDIEVRKVHSTERAILVDHGGKEPVWLPLSVIEVSMQVCRPCRRDDAAGVRRRERTGLMAIPEPTRYVPITIRNMLWPAYGEVRPTICAEDGAPLAGQASTEIIGNRVIVTFLVDAENVRFE